MKTNYYTQYVSQLLFSFQKDGCLQSFKNNIIHNFNRLQCEEPYTKEDILEFIAIYDQPLAYSYVGLNINRYHNFKEMRGNQLGEKLIQLSYNYKRAQWLNEAIYDALRLYETIHRRFDLIPILKNVFDNFKNSYERQIFETYYSYYSQFT